jgi:hypothetical protein
MGISRKDRLNASGFTVIKHEDHEDGECFLIWRDNPAGDVWALEFVGGMVREYYIGQNAETWKSLLHSSDWSNMAASTTMTETEYWDY